MTDPIALSTAAQPAQAAAGADAPGAVRQQAFDPVETRMFARMMQGVNLPPPSVAAPSTMRDAAMSVVAQLSGNPTIEDLRRGILASFDARDPIRTMVAMTDYSMQAHAMFTKLHIATGLASAATSLFGGLLKNQQQ
jgi:hypothetical protein